MESGAILANDKSTVIGGLTLLETESRREAEKFAFDDPFEQAGIRRKTTILRWRFNRRENFQRALLNIHKLFQPDISTANISHG